MSLGPRTNLRAWGCLGIFLGGGGGVNETKKNTQTPIPLGFVTVISLCCQLQLLITSRDARGGEWD